MFTQIKIIAIALIWAGSVWAKPTQFQELFEVVRDSSGTLTEIKLRTKEKTSFQGYVVSSLAPLIVLQREGKLNEAELTKHLSIYEYNSWSKKEKNEIKKALNRLNEIDFVNLLSTPEFKSFFRKSTRLAFEYGELRRSVARPYEPLYFYNSEVRDFFYEAFLDLVSDIFTGGIAEKLIDVFVDRFFNMLEQRRAFYQNTLMHYVTYYEAQDMGLSAAESELVKSSIFDGRLSWHNLSKRKSAKQNWQNFGTIELLSLQAECAENVQKHGDKMGQINGPLSIAFYDVTYNASKDSKQQQRIYNFDNDAGLFEKKPSLAVDHADLNKVFRARVVLDVINFAIEFLPLPGFVIEIPQLFIERKYRPQIESEGALFAAATESGDAELGEIVLRQSLNPLMQSQYSKAFTNASLFGF